MKHKDSHGNLVGNTILKDIYIIRNTINDKVYIGQSTNTYTRWKGHKTAAKTGHYKGSNILYRAMKKLGIENFYYEILEHQIPNYNEREKYWIEFYNSQAPNGYNLTEGGMQYPNYRGIDNPRAAIHDVSFLNEVIEELKKPNLRLTEIAEKYCLPVNTVHGINSGETYHNDELEYPIRKESIPRKLTKEDLVGIVNDLILPSDFTIKEIAKKYHTSEPTINCINIGATHKDIRPEVPRPIRKGYSVSKCLTVKQVDEIIKLILNTSKSYHSIAKQYNVDHRVIINIKNGVKRYKRPNLTYPLRPNN